ncbi:fatty acid hydroxylase domain-containing protein 2 isoform X2 [Chionomys nivalis]|uniref:fatty acid hydroxylase domain-containing protein 2 isoform X2 n=1 Tax=Chionomys nivalis TaxID=269649 RepID=UPI0025981DEC|nr:fatty acid hydroxylase domain-containing protein 2 isoform X2 [Chionomys nivalis]
MRSPGPASRPTQAEPGDNKVSLLSYAAATEKQKSALQARPVARRQRRLGTALCRDDRRYGKPKTPQEVQPGAALVPALCFWGFNGLLLVVDTTGKPTFISRYRIQLGKNEPVDPVKLRQSIRTVVFNQTVISLPMLVIFYPFFKWRQDPCCQELPTFHWFLVELAFFTLVEEILFYYSHRLLHHPTLYKKIHKKHHEWTAPIGVISIYAHPIEHVVSNMLPVMVGPLAMGSHLSSITMWLSLALIITTISHCGYHLPFLPSPEFHDYHHLKFNQCYGVLGVLDHLHGTDIIFKQTKAYERHVLLLGFTPLSESIPDPPKKIESSLGPS